MRPIAGFLGGALGMVIMLECLLRLLPVSHGFASPNLTAKEPAVHYEPGAHYTSSSGWMMRYAVTGRMNRLGFSGPDVPIGPRTVGLIGDSFVDALMIEPKARLGTLLARAPRPVVALGISGTDLADYVVTARWAKTRLGLRYFVIVISPDDLDSSLRPKLRGYWYAPSADGLSVRSSGNMQLRNMVSRSYLGSYLIYNLKASPQDVVSAFHRKASPDKPASKIPESALKTAAAARFTSDLRKLADGGARVLIVVQGDNQAIYRNRIGARNDVKLITAAAQAAGLPVLDLDSAFRHAFATSGLRFDLSDTDPHWNERGQRIAAGAIEQRLLLW